MGPAGTDHLIRYAPQRVLVVVRRLAAAAFSSLYPSHLLVPFVSLDVYSKNMLSLAFSF
jgi:hypothetical protein